MSQNLWSSPLLDPIETDRLHSLYREQRTPLRACDPRVLRSIHAQGKVAFPERYERTPRAEDKPIDQMSVEELVASDGELPSESRKMFLAGLDGCLSLDLVTTNEDGEGLSLADAVSGKFLIEIDDPELDVDNINALRYGTAYTTVDLVTQRQIEWERNQAQNGTAHGFRLHPADDGTIRATKTSRWTTDSTFRKLAGAFRQYLVRLYGADALESFEALEARTALLSEGARVNLGLNSVEAENQYINRELVNMAQPMDEIDHSNFEITEPALMGKRGRLYLMSALSARQANRLIKAGAETVIAVTGTAHRPSQHGKSNDPLWTWHHLARDPNELDVTGIVDSLPRLVRVA